MAYILDRKSTIPIFVQLTNQIRKRIVSGEIGIDQRLPPTRILADELGLSRSTVTSTYEQLVAEGYIEGRRGSGYFSCPVGEVEIKLQNTNMNDRLPPDLPLHKPRHHIHPSFPDMRLFPHRQWARCISRVARLSPQAFIASADSFGNFELRCSISSFLAEWRGLETSPEQIMLTAGSIDALEICLRTLTNSGDYIGLENPGYQPLRNIAISEGMKPVWLDMDEQGAQIPTGKKMPSLSILTPSHHFPLGGAMSPLRRHEFLQWAKQTDSWIIEDDYDSEFRYAGSPIQALAGFDTTNRTIYVGTFSKIFSVGLRLGFLVAPLELTHQFSITLSKYGIKAATTVQKALSEFMNNGELYRHIRRTRRIYGERRKLMLCCLQQKLGDIISIEDHAAGMQLLAALPDHYDDSAIVAAAQDQGLIINSLSSHYAQGHVRQGLVLGFCGFDESEIKSNVTLLDNIIRSNNPAKTNPM